MRGKPLLRLILRGLAIAHPKRRGDIRQVLHDRDKLDALHEMLTEEYEVCEGDGRLMNFLDWLLEHSDEIIKLIMVIIAL